MKTIRLIAFAIFALAVLNSCTFEDSGENPEKWYSNDFVVLDRNWNLEGGLDEIGSYYEYVFPDLLPIEGIISVYMYQNFDTSAEVQLPLPYTEYGVDVFEDGTTSPYSIQYSYDIGADGTIAFKVYVSDYLTSLFRPETKRFRVTIIY